MRKATKSPFEQRVAHRAFSPPQQRRPQARQRVIAGLGLVRAFQATSCSVCLLLGRDPVFKLVCWREASAFRGKIGSKPCPLFDRPFLFDGVSEGDVSPPAVSLTASDVSMGAVFLAGQLSL